MAKCCRVQSWKIGVNAICYRGHRDRIGPHADDDQDERCIAALTVASTSSRNVRIRLKKGLELLDGDVEFVLYPRPGDVYVMDGAMQTWYTHEVPAVNAAGEGPRLAIVFRDGKLVLGAKDSGEPAVDLSPLKRRQHRWGRDLPALEEGGLYSRSELMEREYHMYVMVAVTGVGSPSSHVRQCEYAGHQRIKREGM